jgi:hypothetical protein
MGVIPDGIRDLSSASSRLVVCLHLLAGGCPAASNFLLSRQKKVTKEKATLLSASPLRWRYEGQPAVLGPAGVELELAFGSDNRSP